MAMKQVERLKQQINKSTEVRGISIDETLNKDLLHIMLERKGDIYVSNGILYLCSHLRRKTEITNSLYWLHNVAKHRVYSKYKWLTSL